MVYIDCYQIYGYRIIGTTVPTMRRSIIEKVQIDIFRRGKSNKTKELGLETAFSKSLKYGTALYFIVRRLPIQNYYINKKSPESIFFCFITDKR